MTSKKIEWVDIAKGYGILLVIVGHCLDIDGKLFQFIYVFHMPLFFFLSGYVFNLENFEIVVRKKFRSLIIPFLIFYSLGLIITLLLPFWRSNLSFNGILSDLWLSDPQSVHNSSIWFLVCLFITTIAFDLLIKLSSET